VVSLELVVSIYKISVGSDWKVAWRQTPGHHSHAFCGPPTPNMKRMSFKCTKEKKLKNLKQMSRSVRMLRKRKKYETDVDIRS